MKLLLVFAGGGAGSVIRYLLGVFFRSFAINLPLATFAANMAACLVFALFLYFTKQYSNAEHPLALLILTGFCGGLSTFSTFGYETWLLVRSDMAGMALLNAGLSCVLGVGIFYLVLK